MPGRRRRRGDGRKVGDGPVQQDGGGDLRAGPVAGIGGQDADQAEFGNPDTAGGDGQHGQQPDEREGGKGGLPDGSAEQITIQEATMLPAAAAAMSRACGHVIAPMLAHALP